VVKGGIAATQLSPNCLFYALVYTPRIHNTLSFIWILQGKVSLMSSDLLWWRPLTLQDVGNLAHLFQSHEHQSEGIGRREVVQVRRALVVHHRWPIRARLKERETREHGTWCTPDTVATPL